MKQKITFKLCLAMLGLLLSFSAGAGEVTIDLLKYTLYDDGTASVVAANSSISGEIVIPESVENNNNTYRVTTIGSSAFMGCSGLTSITIPNSVTVISPYAFYVCGRLTSITIPNSVTTIGVWAFAHCYELTAITIGNSVTTIGNLAFWGSNRLREFIVEPDNPNYSSLNGFVYNKQQTEIVQAPLTIKSMTIPNSITTIGNSAFAGCIGLTAITIPNSVTTIGEHAFNGCSGLTSITIPNSVTTIGERGFSSCSGLTSITIGNSVTTIGNLAFDGCSRLTAITIPNSVTTIGNSAFSNCGGLTSITIPNSVTTIGELAFLGSSGLREFIVEPDNPNYSSLNGFVYNKQQTEIIQAPLTIKSVTIPNSITTIGNSAFAGCSGLTAITIPNSVTTIGNNAFNTCSGLTSITIPNSVTTIGNGAFGNGAFGNCTKLQEIKVYVEEPITITNWVFYAVDYSTCKLYVSQGSIEKYQAAAVWSKFTNISALPIPTAIGEVDENKLNVYSVDGKVVIKNLRKGEAISICNTTGQNVYQGNETEVPLNKGIYFVKVGTIVSKVMVQ